MRDIRPQRPKQRNLRGARVPVTSVHVPGVKAAAEFIDRRPLFFDRKKKRRRGLSLRWATSGFRIGPTERRVVLSVFALLLVALLLAGFIFLPSAEGRLVLRTAPLLIDEKLTIKAEPALHVLAENGMGVVPGTTFFRELQLHGESPVTSTKVLGKKASGTVRITNRTVEQQKIKENSRLVTAQGTLFFMKSSVFVAPNNSAKVTVEAAEAGTGGNISPQRLTFAALPATSASILYAEAEQAFAGGSGEVVTVVQGQDLEQAKTAVTEAGRKQAEGEIKKELPQGWVLLPESWSVEASSFETDAKVDDQRVTIPYTAKVVARVLGYQEDAFKEHLQKALEARLDKDHMLFPGDISFSVTVESVDWAKNEGVVIARVTHTTIPRFSVDALRDKLAGRSQPEAKEYLQGLPGVGSADITLSPFWVRAIPRIRQRVKIDLVPEQQP